MSAFTIATCALAIAIEFLTGPIRTAEEARDAGPFDRRAEATSASQ